MQVNMPENMPGPAFERTTTKPAETDTTGAPTPFFAQIGQIMNPDRERPEDKTDEANARQAPVQSNSESRGVRRNPSVSSKGSVKAEQVPTNEKTGTESRMSRIGNSAAAAIRILNQARIAKSNSDVTVRETPVETRPLSQIRNGSDSKNIQNESKNVFSDSNAVSGRNLKESITQSEGFKTGSLFKPDSAAKPKLPLDSNIIQTKPVKTESGSAADARVFPDRNSQDESSNPIILRKPGVTLTAQLPRRNAAVAQAARNQSSKAPVEPQAPDAARMTQPGSRREAGIRSGSASVLEEPVFADNLQTVRNIRVSNDNSHTVAAKKPDNTKTSAIENANTGNSNSGQNAGHNESASWTILQNNLGSSRADSGFGKTSSADPPDRFGHNLQLHCYHCMYLF